MIHLDNFHKNKGAFYVTKTVAFMWKKAFVEGSLSQRKKMSF